VEDSVLFSAMSSEFSPLRFSVTHLCTCRGAQLVVECKLEDPELLGEQDLANQMGLFLQKTNIIRDYREDIDEVPPR
jgi:hypothetical protein